MASGWCPLAPTRHRIQAHRPLSEFRGFSAASPVARCRTSRRPPIPHPFRQLASESDGWSASSVVDAIRTRSGRHAVDHASASRAGRSVPGEFRRLAEREL
jgi:hypothetical protein